MNLFHHIHFHDIEKEETADPYQKVYLKEGLSRFYEIADLINDKQRKVLQVVSVDRSKDILTLQKTEEAQEAEQFLQRAFA